MTCRKNQNKQTKAKFKFSPGVKIGPARGNDSYYVHIVKTKIKGKACHREQQSGIEYLNKYTKQLYVVKYKNISLSCMHDVHNKYAKSCGQSNMH
jgi:hypothetical protein